MMLSDIVENAIGAISSVLFFFALRSGTPGPFIDYKLGLILAIVWLSLLYHSFEKRGDGIKSFLTAIIVSGIICTYLTVAFKLATWEQINTIKTWLGSPALITTLMAVPVALLFDMMNIKSVLSRYYIRK